MKNPRKTRLAYSLALAAMATTLSTLQAYADDPASPAPEARPPQMAPAMPQDTTRVLGVLRNDDMSGTPSVSTSSASLTPSGDVLQAKQSGSITYITGGVGDEEQQALEVAKKDYNLYILNSDRGGAYVGDPHVVIRDSKGHTLLETPAGPLFYAHLPAGTYIVEASLGGQTQKKTVTLSPKKTASPTFVW